LPTSNLQTNIYPSIDCHPIEAADQAFASDANKAHLRQHLHKVRSFKKIPIEIHPEEE